MYEAADLVVVGSQVGDVGSIRYGERLYPVVAIKVEDYLKGKGPSSIDVLQSVTTLDERGGEVPLVSGSGNFLLFLTEASAAGKSVRDGLYTPVTEVMGSYFESEPGSGEFLALDDSNPLLPEVLSAVALERIVAKSREVVSASDLALNQAQIVEIIDRACAAESGAAEQIRLELSAAAQNNKMTTSEQESAAIISAFVEKLRLSLVIETSVTSEFERSIVALDAFLEGVPFLLDEASEGRAVTSNLVEVNEAFKAAEFILQSWGADQCSGWSM